MRVAKSANSKLFKDFCDEAEMEKNSQIAGFILSSSLSKNKESLMLVLSTPSFNKDISKIKDRKLTARIENAIKKMQSADKISDVSGVKMLFGSSNSYRIKIADYRLGFTMVDGTIRLIIFAHRKEIYRYFP